MSAEDPIAELTHLEQTSKDFGFYWPNVNSILKQILTKYKRRFHALKALTKARGFSNLKGRSREFMLELWDEVKAEEGKEVN